MTEDSQALVPIEEKAVVFYEDELTAVLVETDKGQEIYVPVRPIVENLGLAWSPQLRRINRDPVLSGESISVTVKVTETGQRGAMTCLPLKFLPGFLSRISVSRLTDPRAVSRLVSYQHGLTACIADSFFVVLRSDIKANALTILELSEEEDPESLREVVTKLAQAPGIPLALPTTDPQRQWKVYIAKLERMYKIGCSRDVLARIQELRGAGAAARLGIELVHCFPADRPYKAERHLRESYADKREVGEWFRLSRTDVLALFAITSFKVGIFTPEVWQ